MFWIVAGSVAVVLLALAWWSSGRARPGIEQHQPSTEELYQVIRDHRPSDGGGSGLV